MLTRGNILDKISKYFFLLCAVFSIIAVAMIAIFIIVNGYPAFSEIGVFQFIFGDSWNLTKGEFGIFPMVVGSIYITGGAIIIGVSIGLLSAIYISKFAPQRARRILKSGVNLLAGIPSVIYGFFGMKFVVPILTDISGMDGDGMLAASIILGIMILPTIISISVNSLDSVPQSYYEGAVAMGATKEQAIFKVVTPAAKSGIMTSVVLGVGRALGETMAVILVAGNSPVFPEGLFSSIRTLTGNVVMEMAYAERGSLHLASIIATGAVLLVFVMIINICLNLFNNKKDKLKEGLLKRAYGKAVSGVKGAKAISPPDDIIVNSISSDGSLAVSYPAKSTTGVYKAAKYSTYGAMLTAIISLLTIIVFIFVNGIPHLSADLLFNTESEICLLPSFISTLMLIFLSLIIALPLGIFAAIYLNEYTKPGSRIVKIIRLGTETLAGVPSIIFGLFGMLFFRYTLGMPYSLLAGSLTLVLMILPTIIRTTEESLKCIPISFREASLALGASKTRTLFKVVLPCAFSGIINAIILSVGRIVGESAALLFTAGSNMQMPDGYNSSGASLTVALYTLANEGLHINEAYATAVILIIFVLIINIASELIDKKFSKKVGSYA